MSVRVPSLAVLLFSLGVGVLAVCLRNAVIAAICFSIAALYAALMFWQWRRRKKNQ